MSGGSGLQIRNLSKTYFDPNAGQHTVAVQGLSLDIHPGKFLALLEPSGCAKMTLLNIVAGFLPPTERELTLNCRRIQGPGPDRGIVFQSFALVRWKMVLENVAFGLKMRRAGRQERQHTACEFIDLVGLTGFEAKYPHELSGAMQ